MFNVDKYNKQIIIPLSMFSESGFIQIFISTKSDAVFAGDSSWTFECNPDSRSNIWIASQSNVKDWLGQQVNIWIDYPCLCTSFHLSWRIFIKFKGRFLRFLIKINIRKYPAMLISVYKKCSLGKFWKKYVYSLLLSSQVIPNYLVIFIREMWVSHSF